jgi:hypothetical protein
MSEMSFGTGAEARRRIGNVFLAFAEVKHATPRVVGQFVMLLRILRPQD